jgi:hypothetical protein
MQCRPITGRLAIVIPDTASADAVVGLLLAAACIVLLRVSRAPPDLAEAEGSGPDTRATPEVSRAVTRRPLRF